MIKNYGSFRSSFFVCILHLTACSYPIPRLAPDSLIISHLDYPSDDIGSGAGCYFAPAGEKESNFVFIQDAATGPWMKIIGENTNLEWVDGLWPEHLGDTGTLRLKAPDLDVEFEVKKTSECKEGQECGGESFSGTITARSGHGQQSVRVSGGCGC